MPETLTSGANVGDHLDTENLLNEDLHLSQYQEFEKTLIRRLKRHGFYK